MAIELTRSPEHACRGCVRETCVGCPEISVWLATIHDKYVVVPARSADDERNDLAPWEAP